MRTIVLSLFLAMLSATSVHAANWIPYGKGPIGSSSYDKESLKITQGVIRVWVLSNFAEPKKNVRSLKVLREIDCNRAVGRMVSGWLYSNSQGEGELVGSFGSETADKTLEPIPPDTDAELLMKELCPPNR